jgi:hypothetical protein
MWTSCSTPRITSRRGCSSMTSASRRASPWIYSAAVEGYGVTMTIIPHETACLRCLYQKPPQPGTLPTCETSGVINSIPGVIASVASAEALKVLAGVGSPNAGVLYIDLWENAWQWFAVGRRDDCPACALRRFEYLEAGGGGAVTLCGRDAVQVRPARAGALDLEALAARLRAVGEVFVNEYLLRFRRGNSRLCSLPTAGPSSQGHQTSRAPAAGTPNTLDSKPTRRYNFFRYAY